MQYLGDMSSPPPPPSDLEPEESLDAAVAHHRAGRLDAARAGYAAILRALPDHADALHLLGVTHAQTGAHDRAVSLIGRALALVPGSAAYRANLVKALRRLDVGAWATALLDAADALADLGRSDPAIAIHRLALAADPTDPRGWFNLAITLRDAGRRAEAGGALSRADTIRPMARAALERGALLLADGEPGEALAAFRTALSRDPTMMEAWLGAGNAASAAASRVGNATEYYGRALTLAPDHATAWFNLGVTHGNRGDSADRRAAVVAYRRAVAIEPDMAAAHYNLSHHLLLDGALEEGWVEFEWRFRIGVRADGRGRPRWRGEDVAGRTVMLRAEQGHGDTLQFIRYAPMLAARGARVTVECPPEMVRLVSGVAGVASAHAFDAAPPFDLWCPMMSLPLAFGTTLDSIPAAVPYLPRPAVATRRDGTELAVGLVWSGDPRAHDPRLFQANRRRSVPLDQWAPLFDVRGVRFVGLQMGAAARERESAPFGDRIADPMGAVRDFADTTAIVAGLDLVIAVDTSVVHLAGGMGCPVWVLSRFDGCWRWLVDRGDSPWYPTARIFRQTTPGDWTPVMAEVAAALARHVAAR